MGTRGSHRIAHLALALYVAAALLALAGPGAVWAGGRVEPFVLGLPFSFAWYAGWAVLTFVALSLYYFATGGGEE